MKSKFMLLLSALFASISMSFAKTQIDTLFYDLNASNHTAKVVYDASYNQIVSIHIPDTVSFGGVNYSVTEVGDEAFKNCNRIITAYLPDGITKIGSGAFYNSSLSFITIPNSLTSIGNHAFYSSKLREIVIPNSVTNLGSAAFYNCSLLSLVILGNGITTLDVTFYNCSKLTSLTIPNSVTSLGNSTFYNCTGLTSINIPNSVTNIGYCVFQGCSSLTSISIPNSVTNIGYSAFQSCVNLTSISIPNGVKSIKSGTFSSCQSLSSVIFSDSITEIGNNAFAGCSSLTSINIPNSVTSIGYRAFERCSNLTSVTIGNNLTDVGYCVFENCTNLNSVYISDVAAWCRTFLEGSSNPMYYAHKLYLNGVQITDLIIPEGVTRIEEYSFHNCSSITSVTIPESVKSIGSRAFENCGGITSIVIPDSVASIEYRAFANCTRLSSINIPQKITSIGNDVFQNCTNLKRVTINSDTIASLSGDWKNNTFGSQVKEYILGDSVTQIGNNAFYNVKSLVSITIGNNVASIGNQAFYGCLGLSSITIPSSVTSIDNSAFTGCSGLKSIRWNVANFSDFSSSANTPFYSCRSNITSFEFGDSVQHIPNNICSGMDNLTSVTIPESVTSIGNRAFENCSGLDSITIGNNVTTIGMYAFLNCTGLTSVTIPKSVTNINSPGGSPFTGCNIKKLTLYSNELASRGLEGLHDNSLGVRFRFIEELVLGDSITYLGTQCFHDCNKLKSVTCYSITPPTMSTQYRTKVFDGVNCSVIPLYVPAQSVATYKAADQWKDFHPILAIGTEWITYTVTFVDWNGSILKTEVVDAGESATPPSAPYRNGYTFIGWDGDYTNVSSDLTITALYQEDTSIIDDGPITVRLDSISPSAWEIVYLWAWTTDGNLFDAWPGIIISKDDEGWYSYQFDENIKNVNIIWNNGIDQTIDITNVTESTCYALNSTSGRTITVSVVDCPLTEDLEESVATNNNTQKAIQNGHLYILLPDGTRYDATGKKVE